jgi:UDP-glucuronate 4-epimerase
MRVLVSGAAGFVGHHLVARFLRGGATVEALDLDVPGAGVGSVDADAQLGDADAQLGDARWHRGDVTDRAAMDALVARLRPEVIVHAAAVTPSPEGERAEPARVFDVNAGGTLALLEAARRHGVGTFVFVSSAGVYGPRPPLPVVDAASPVRADGLYAVAKLASDGLCLRYAAGGGPRVRIGRLGTAYGPGERASSVRSVVSAVTRAAASAAAAVATAASGGVPAPLRVAGAEVARDFVHAADAADAYWWLAIGADVPPGPYLVGAARAEPLSVALDALAAAAPAFRWAAAAADAADLVQTPAQGRAGMDLGPLERATPWRRRFTLAAGAVDTLAWALEGAAAT